MKIYELLPIFSARNLILIPLKGWDNAQVQKARWKDAYSTSWLTYCSLIVVVRWFGIFVVTSLSVCFVVL
jgi:hypothetical protein